jgi:hypothetical protein
VRDLVFLVFGQFLVSLLVALAALCAFVWAAAAGLMRNVERVKYQVLEVETPVGDVAGPAVGDGGPSEMTGYDHRRT